MSASPWWIWRPVQERLIAFGQALIAPLGVKYRILVRPGQSFCNAEHRQIQIDPESFPDEPPRVQFLATQDVIVHEAGHALFSVCTQRLMLLANCSSPASSRAPNREDAVGERVRQQDQRLSEELIDWGAWLRIQMDNRLGGII